MTHHSPEEAEALRIKKKIGDGSAQTKVFHEWNEGVREFLLSHVSREAGEQPIFAHYKNSNSWLLTTTRRVLWTNPDTSPAELRHENIKRVGWSSGPDDFWPKRDEASPPDTLVFIDIDKGTRGHCSWYSPWLHLIDYTGTRHEVFLEAGKILTSIRNSIWQLSGGWRNSANEQEFVDARSVAPTGSDAYRVRRVEFAFNKYSEVRTHTRLYSGFAPDVQELLLSRLSLAPAEIPAMAFFEDPDQWLVLTSRRLVWSGAGSVHHIAYHEVHNMGSSEGPEPPKHCEHQNARDYTGERLCKICIFSSPWIFVVTADGRRFEIAVEEGSTSIVLECFRMMRRFEETYPRLQ